MVYLESWYYSWNLTLGTHFTGELLLAIYKEKGLVKKGDLHSQICPLEAKHPSFLKQLESESIYLPALSAVFSNI